jgi:hypothetical protein
MHRPSNLPSYGDIHEAGQRIELFTARLYLALLNAGFRVSWLQDELIIEVDGREEEFRKISEECMTKSRPFTI